MTVRCRPRHLTLVLNTDDDDPSQVANSDASSRPGTTDPSRVGTARHDDPGASSATAAHDLFHIRDEPLSTDLEEIDELPVPLCWQIEPAIRWLDDDDPSITDDDVCPTCLSEWHAQLIRTTA